MRSSWLAILAVLSIGVLGWAQNVEVTVWQLRADAFPGDLQWVDAEILYVGLQNPRGVGELNPETGVLRTWDTRNDPGEFEVIGGRLFTTHFFEGQISWLNLDYGMLSIFDLPNAPAQPARLVNADPTQNTIRLFYLDWASGRVGEFAPIESGPADDRDLSPRTTWLPSNVRTIAPIVDRVTAEFYPHSPSLPPAVRVVQPTVTGPFTEWLLFSPNEPWLDLARTADGRIWLGCNPGEPIHALAPWNNEVTLYDVPGDPWVLDVAAGPLDEICYLARSADETVALGVLEGVNGDVSLWQLPGTLDPINLRVIDNAFWFVDRGLSAVCRLTPWDSTLTRWITGVDDGPLFVVPGGHGEVWVSNERSGQILRLRLPE